MNYAINVYLTSTSIIRYYSLNFSTKPRALVLSLDVENLSSVQKWALNSMDLLDNLLFEIYQFNCMNM